MQLLLAVKFLGTIQSWLSYFTHIGAALEMLTVGYAGQQHQFVPFPWFSCRWPEVVTLGTVAVLVAPWQCANVLAVSTYPGCAAEASSVWMAITYSLCFLTLWYHKIRRKFVLMTQPLQ